MEANSLAVPSGAAWLGGLGLLPFVAGALLVATTDSPWAIDGLRSYGAIILSFLGGIHWGLAIADDGASSGLGAIWPRLGASVIPALIAWVALLLDPTMGFLLLAIAFVLLLLGDLAATRRGFAPRWYPRLRVPLTSIAVLSLVLGASV